MGAATCLLVAGTLAMTLVSGLIAFNGWPGLGVQDVSEQAALVADVRNGTGTDAVVTAAPLRVRPPAPAPRVSPPRARRAAVAASSRPTAQRATGPTQSGGSRTRPPEPVVKGPEPLVPGVPAAEQPVSDLGKTLTTTVDSTGKVVTGLITPTAPVTGPIVQDTTDVVGGLVGQVVGAVGTVVDGLGQPPAGTP